MDLKRARETQRGLDERTASLLSILFSLKAIRLFRRREIPVETNIKFLFLNMRVWFFFFLIFHALKSRYRSNILL